VVAEEFRVKEEDLRGKIYGSLARPVAARMLCKHADLTQREAGRLLGYGAGTAVSMQLRRLREELEKTVATQNRVARIEKKLKALNRH